MSIYIRFDAELRLYGDDIPEALNYSSLGEAIEKVLGPLGVTGIDVTEYEDSDDE